MLTHGGNYGEKTIDYSVNINPTIKASYIKGLLEKSVAAVAQYPEMDGQSLLALIGHKWQIAQDRLLVGSGATELLYHLARTLTPKTVLIVQPTFSEYEQAFTLFGSQVHPLHYDIRATIQDNEAKLLEQVKKIKADLVVICNPNNPTGHLYSTNFIEEMTEIQVKHKGYVLVDESFIQFTSRDSCYEKDWWNLIVLTSLTKYYRIPGLRVGYLTSNYSLIKEMKVTQPPWHMNGVTLYLTKALLENQQIETITRTWYIEEKAYMMAALNKLAYITPIEGHANYILCKLTGTTGEKMNQYLQSQVEPKAIRSCGDFTYLSEAYIRIGLKSHLENEALVEAFINYEEVKK